MRSITRNPVCRTGWIVVVVFLLIVVQSWAEGGEHYPNGAEDFAVGVLPPPGTYLVNYMLLARKNSLRDNSGNSLPANFSASVFAEVPRLIYVSPYKLFGANVAAHFFIPYYSADVTASSSAIPSLNFNTNDKGVGDIIFDPFILGWHFSPEFHAAAGVDIWAPTGNYDKSNPASQILSRNIWTFEPVVAASYLKDGFDLSLKMMYDFNTDNHDYLLNSGATGKLSPGQEFHIDWAVGYDFREGLTGGVVGYNYWQVTDDEVNGVRQQNDKSQVGGVGVGGKYWPKHGPFSMTLKQYWEYGARNIATGPQSQFKVSYAF